MVLFVRRSVGRQQEAVQQPKAQHQRKHQTFQRHFFAQCRPDGERRQHRRRAAHQQEEPRQVAADALVGDLHRHRAVDDTVVHGHLLFPEGDAIAVADGQNRVGRVVRRHSQAIASPLLPGHSGVKAQRRVLVGHDVVHRADGAGQLLAGIGVVQDDVQLTLGLLAGKVKFKADRQNILVVGKDLLGGFAVVDELGTQEIGDDLTASLRRLRAHLGQPEQHHRRQQHDERRQRGRQGGIGFLFWIFHAISRKCEITTPRRTPFPPRPSTARRCAKSSRLRRARHPRRRAGGRCNRRGL